MRINGKRGIGDARERDRKDRGLVRYLGGRSRDRDTFAWRHCFTRGRVDAANFLLYMLKLTPRANQRLRFAWCVIHASGEFRRVFPTTLQPASGLPLRRLSSGRLDRGSRLNASPVYRTRTAGRPSLVSSRSPAEGSSARAGSSPRITTSPLGSSAISTRAPHATSTRR